MGMTRYSTAILSLLVATGMVLGALPAHAEDSPSEALEIDLEALEGLNPGREDKQAAPDAPLLPGESAADPSNTMTSTPDIQADPGALMEAPPQDPAAPRPDVVSTAPAGTRTAASLRDQIIPVLFQPESNQITLKAATALDGIIDLVKFKGVRLQLKAYAGKEETSQSTMRRLALQRAIAVRGYLMNHGIAGTRIDVRPQGVAPDSPFERVDIIFLPQ